MKDLCTYFQGQLTQENRSILGRSHAGKKEYPSKKKLLINLFQSYCLERIETSFFLQEKSAFY